MLFVAIKRYATKDEEFYVWIFRPDEALNIFERVFILTYDPDIALEAANWTKSAIKGGIFKFHEGEIEILMVE